MAGLQVYIGGKDGTGGVTAQVTERGQLIVAPLDYDKSYVAIADAADTAFNLVVPQAERNFVISSIGLTGTKSIDPNTDATVEIYEADSADTTVVVNSLVLFSVPRSGLIPFPGLNIITENSSKFINIKTSDATVNCTLMGYYIGHHHEI